MREEKDRVRKLVVTTKVGRAWSLPIASELATGRKRRVNFGCRRLESDADVAPRFLASSSMKLLTRLLEKERRPFSFFDIDLSRVWMANNPSFCHSQIPKGSEAKGSLKPENACSFSRIVSMIYHPIFAH